MLGEDELESTCHSMACSCHSAYTESLTMSFLERWLQEKAQAAAYLKVLMQPWCTDDCGLEQGSIIPGLAGTERVHELSSPL